MKKKPLFNPWSFVNYDKFRARHLRAFRGIKDKDAPEMARIISDWSRGAHPEISDARIAQWLRSFCKNRQLGQIGRAVDAIEKDRARVGENIRSTYYGFIRKTGRIPSSREIAKLTAASERTVKFVLDECGANYRRLKPWQQPK